MKTKEPVDALKELIELTEAELKTEGEALKAQFYLAYDSLKPMNILKGVLKDMFATPELKADVMNAAIGLTTGFVAKKVLVGKSQNPLTKLAGVLVELVVASNVIGNGDEIRSMANVILKKISGSTARAAEEV